MSDDPDADILGVDELFDRPGEWEIRATIYRNGRKIAFADGLGISYDHALNTVETNLERRDVQIHMPKRRKELGS